MRHIAFLLIAGLLLSASSCKREDHAPGYASNACDNPGGFTMRDEMGALMGVVDTTDWHTTDDWCPEVEDLFQPIEGLTWASAPDSLAIAAYPNPSASQVAFQVDLETGSYMDLRIARENLQVVHASDSLTATLHTFQLNTMGLDTGELVRLYYRIVHPDGTANRGHGDVKFLP